MQIFQILTHFIPSYKTFLFVNVAIKIDKVLTIVKLTAANTRFPKFQFSGKGSKMYHWQPILSVQFLELTGFLFSFSRKLLPHTKVWITIVVCQLFFQVKIVFLKKGASSAHHSNNCIISFRQPLYFRRFWEVLGIFPIPLHTTIKTMHAKWWEFNTINKVYCLKDVPKWNGHFFFKLHEQVWWWNAMTPRTI